MAVAAAVAAAATSEAAPTGTAVLDIVWRAAPIAALVLLGARGTRLSWVWLAGVAAVASVGAWPATVASVAALGLAGASAWAPTRPRVVGAVACGLAGCALLSLPSVGFHGAELVIGAVAVAPAVYRGYLNSPRGQRRTMRRVLVVGLAGCVLVGVGLLAVVGLSARSLQDGVAAAQDGLARTQQGEHTEGAERFDDGRAAFDRAEGLLSSPLTWPARAIPVLAQNVEAMAVAARSGEGLTAAAGDLSESAPYQDLKAESGRLDLALVQRMGAPLADAEAVLESTDRSIAVASSPWLLPPVAEAIDRLDAEVTDVLPDTRLAGDVVQVLPAMLGGDGDRRYLVWFTTPAETRNLGGFIGAYGVLEARDGHVELVESGGIADLMAQDDWRTRSLEDREEFLTRYGRYHPDRFLQNLSASPDMATTADVSAHLYEQVTGETVDGVMAVDPHGLAALIELTGPVAVPGLDRALDADEAADYLLRRQYVELDDVPEDVRTDLLIETGRSTFEALTSGSLPGPRVLGDVLGPVVEGKHLMFFPLDDDEAAVIDDLGALGRFQAPTGSDFVSLRTSNLRSNKIDAYLHRRLDYRATYDPSTGRVEAVATVTLRNDAPASGLPDIVIGPADSRHPVGTNLVRASIYTPLVAEGASIDGALVGLEPQRELGLHVFTTTVAVPAGATVTLEVHLSGMVDDMPRDEYRLTLSSQPMANPDEVVVEVVPVDSAPPVRESAGLPIGDLRREETGAVERRYAVSFA